MSRVLIVGARDSSIDYLDDRSITIDLLQSPERLTARQSAVADRVRLVDLHDMPAALEAAAELHADAPLDGVTAFHEAFLVLAARIHEALGIAGNPLLATRAALDKAATRAAVGRSGLRNPYHRVVLDAGQLIDAVREAGLPCVVKPVDGAGSAGVRVISDPAQLVPDTVNRRWPLLVESYIDGPEFSVETVSRDGRHEVIAITEKLVTDGQWRVELGHQLPARLPAELAAHISESVAALLDRLGHRVGPAHTEFRLRDGEPYLIETHTRYGGDRIWEMTGLVTGCFPQPATIAALASRPHPRRDPIAPAAAIRFLTGEPGVVDEVTGVEEAQACPGVHEVVIDAVPGTEVRQLRSSEDRIGYVLATGDDVVQAIAAAEHAASRVRVRLR
ncbi:ATP-grasp domain-containing protein [Actinoplanes regularis]|uniref:Biotin carboxylase n=1 Tax=Actinoplanes regularis TaxID=52697 RepID=A0A238X6C2_9ACTN|nr:ATP-grasp domain-containing protein [Actinoplanes regularis]GIE86469.1 argininosuccinate lyase [Actinoplanes regularis]SNR54182.1 Biotin carboxylase [Actinoplanes regularis]